MKKAISLIAAAAILLSLAGCGKYTSHYKAVGFVHSNLPDSAFMSFYSFDGRMVFKLKSPGEGDIRYTAKLESGSVTVGYDYGGTRSELFSVKGGEELDSHGGYVESGTVYIVVETDGECRNGDLRFEVG